MKICYVCECCEDVMQEVDDLSYEAGLGLPDLTEKERQDIIEMDYGHETMTVKTLCDECLSTLGLDFDEDDHIHPYYRH